MRLTLLDKLMQGPERRFSERASRLLDRGKAARAADVLRSGLEKIPESIDLHVSLVRVLLLDGQIPQALEEADRLLRRKRASHAQVSQLVETCSRRGLSTSGLRHALAQHHIRECELSEAVAHLARIDRRELDELHQQSTCRFLDKRDDPSRTVADAQAAVYAALAREVMGEDRAALEMYRDVLHLDPDLFPGLQPRLQGLAQRHAGDSTLRMAVVTLLLTHADENTAAQDALEFLEGHPDTAAPLAARLAERHARNPEEGEIAMALARARWIEGQHDQALEVLAPLAARGRHLEALEPLLSRWRLDRPDVPRSAVLLADVLGQQGRGEQALHAITEVAQRTPPAHLEGPLRRLLQRYPDEPKVYLQLACLQQRNDEPEECMQALEQHLQRAPEQRADAVPVLWALLEGQPSHSAAHLMLAKSLLEQGQLNPAATLLRHLIQQLPEEAGQLCDSLESLASSNPGHSGVRLAAAEAWMVSEQPKRALPHLEAAAQDAARAAEVAHRLSMILERWPEEAEQAESLVEQMQARLLQPAAGLYLSAQLHAACGRVEQTVQALEDCYAEAPQRAAGPVRRLLEPLVLAHQGASRPRLLLAQVLSGSGEPQRAVSLVLDVPNPEPELIALVMDRLQAVAAEHPGDVLVQSSLARMLLFVERPAAALETAQRALAGSIGTATGGVYMVHGDALEAVGRCRDAVASWQQAVALEPALNEQAVARLERLYEADPDDAEIQLLLGRMLAEGADMERGVGLLVDLATRHPDHARRAFTQAEALARSHETDYQPALAAARILGATAELPHCAGWSARALQRGAPCTRVDQLLGDLIREHPAQPDLLRCQALARATRRPEDSCRLLARSAQGGSQQAGRALEVLQRVASLHPDLPLPGLVAARIHLDLGDSQAAFHHLKTALEKGEPCDEALELLTEIQDIVPGEPQVHISMARCLLLRSRGAEALAAVQHAVDAGAGADSLDPLLQSLVNAEVPGALLERARIHVRRSHLEQALADLQQAVEQGLQRHVLETLRDLLIEHPEELEARLLQLRLLRESGDREGALQCLDEALELKQDGALRLDWMLRRAEVRRELGDVCGATEDLEQARRLAPDPDAFLERVHQRRRRRIARQLDDAAGAERVRLLLELGLWEEAGRHLSAERRDEPELRELRARLLLARGDAAAGLRVLHPGVADRRMVDAAQRCDRPEVALAGLDRMLEDGEDSGLREARRRVVQDLWRRDLDPGSRALVARIPFEPEPPKQ